MKNDPYNDWVDQDNSNYLVKLEYLKKEGKITPEEYKRLKEMHISPDKENAEVARTVIETKDNQHDNIQSRE